MKKNNYYTRILSFLFFGLFFVIMPLLSYADSLDYVPMEKIPGFEEETSGDFFVYISQVYKFGLWFIGVAALFMITFGGYVYLTSAGNNSSMEKAKGVITDAVIGLLLALSAWLILYVINPDLVQIKRLEPGAQTRQREEQLAKEYDGIYPDIQSKLPSNCNDARWQDIFNRVSAATGVSKCILLATAAKESGCNQQPPRTLGGRDCSVMQIAAADNCGTTCDDLEKNPEKAVTCAANYLKKLQSKWRKSPTEQWVRDAYAGYNGGPVALEASQSCAGMVNKLGNSYKKWDCRIDCGGYCPVPARTSTFLDYYRQCQGS